MCKHLKSYVSQQVQEKADEAKRIREELAQLEVASDQLQVGEITAGVLCDFLRRFEDIYENLETGQRRLLVQSLVKEVVIQNRNECRALFTIPLPEMPQPPNGENPSVISITNGKPTGSYPFYPTWGG